jgi:hypothetical protein
MKTRDVLLVVMLFCMLGLVAQASLSVTTANENGADTYVANDDGSIAPDANMGTENRFRIRVMASRVRVGLLRFDLTNVLVDPANATLSLEQVYAKSSGKAVSVYGLTDDSLDDWIESGTGGVSFQTAPGIVWPVDPGVLDIDETKTVLLGTFTSVTTVPTVITTDSATVDLEGFIRGDTNGLITLLIVGDDDEAEFATKERTDGSLWPTLNLPDANDIVARAYDPSPAPYTTVSPDLATLSWTNPEPNNPGESITCDVYFGTTEPNGLEPHFGLPLLQADITGNSVAAPEIFPFDTYYWIVDIHDSSFPDRTVPGFVWQFDTNNAAPLVDAGEDQYVWVNKATVDADTYLRDDTVRGDYEFMDVRGGGNDFAGYLRFNLAELGATTINDASLTLTVSGGASRNDTVTNGRFALYGLNNVAGNTPQNWDETVLMDTNTGQEWDSSMPMTTALTNGWITDLDDNVAGITEICEGGAPGDTITISGAPLVAFLQSRLNDNGLATFILCNDDGSDRGYGIATKENSTSTWAPALVLSTDAPNNGDAEVLLDGTVEDDDLPDPPAAYTVLWEQISGPENVSIDPNDVEDVTVHIGAPGTYEFRLTADDSDQSTSDIVQVYVGVDSCDAAQADPDYEPYQADFNSDCVVDLTDFAVIAGEWLECNSLECVEE